MRLKSSNGALQVVYNRNNDPLQSPKRINTIQNTNYTQNLQHVTTNQISHTANKTHELTIDDVTALKTITQEFQEYHSGQKSHFININRLNINNTLATQLRMQVQQKNDQLMLQSPDEIFIDDDETLQSCGSSIQASPQEENRLFDSADSADSSDEGNDCSTNGKQALLRSFINPNYPGFQHLAHTLNFDEDHLTGGENNNNENFEITLDKIDSANVVENIQKIFQDKSLGLPDSELTCDHQDSSEDNYNTNSSVSETSDSNESIGGSSIAENYNVQIDEKKLMVQFEKSDCSLLDKETESNLDEQHTKSCNSEPFSSKNPKSPEILKKQAPYSLTIPTILNEKKEATLARMAKNLNARKALESKQSKESDQSKNQSNSVSYKKMGKQVPCFLPLNNIAAPSTQEISSPIEDKMADATLSNCQEDIMNIIIEESSKSMNFDQMIDSDNKKVNNMDSATELQQIETHIRKIKSETISHMEKNIQYEMNALSMHLRRPKDYNQQCGSLITFPKQEFSKRETLNRRSVPVFRGRKKPINSDYLAEFDVFNMETAMPKIDLEAIENHLKSAKEDERRRQTDREEIRRRLAMGSEDDYCTDRPGRKSSLQSRLQSGMNLQICFMNDTVSDNESPSSDNECPLTNPKPAKTLRQNNSQNKNLNCSNGVQPAQRPVSLSLHPTPQFQSGNTMENDFFTKQARLQTEARMALAQAKEMARMQMEIEKQKLKKSPITEMVRHSLEKIGIPFPENKRRLSRQILTDMNVAQLQVIVNDLHTQIETLNEQLVKFLMDRDDLHMEQDSMLVDIEDLTRYLGAKEQVAKEQNLAPTPQNNNLTEPMSATSSPLASLNNTVRPHLNRIASLVKK
ncbi:hypothetical protein ABEB36_003563 [Hypothenemus hampei]|uniref:Schwannomin interacting protein 1 C-terminal domain-containing protein n=1 Tax=Hypothenemus hampei TaxID=57062 RepID=A0ABD1FCS0_HYPHA